MIIRDLVHAKRRRLRKAADGRRGATPVVEGPTAPLGEETEEPVVTVTTGPAVDEAMRPVGETPLEEATASPPPAESQFEEAAKTPLPPRPDAPLEPPETPAVETAGTSTQTPGGVDVEMEEGTPPPPPPNSEPEGEATSSEAAAGEAAVEPLVARPPSPAPEAHEEVVVENNDAQDGGGPLLWPRADPGPSTVLSAPEAGAGVEDAAPREGSWALVLSDRSRSSACRQAALRLVRGTLDGLETQLALEEAELGRRYDALAADWARFFEVRRRSGLDDRALQAQRDEATRQAQEIRENAEREAQEALAPVQAERKAAAEDREAAVAERQAAASDRAAIETSLADQRKELASREEKIISEAEVVRKSLEQHRLSLEAREQAMTTREAEVLKREEKLEQAETDMNREREALESRESSLAEAMGKHDKEVERHRELVEKANQKLAEKKKEAEAEALTKQKEYRTAVTQAVSREYAGKFKKQEDGFQKKRRELGKRIRQLEEWNANLKSSLKRAKDANLRTEQALERSEQDLTALMADMQELNAQVAPVVERVEEAEQSAVAARVLTQQRERMFRSLVTRGNALAAKLGVDAPAVPVHGNADVATYLAYFDQLFSVLEGPVAELDDVVDEECRKLLLVAVERVFVNLKRLYPCFDFESVTEPMEDAQIETRLSNSLREEINDYVNRFKRVAEERASGEEEDVEEEGAEEDDAEEDKAAKTSA